MSWPTPQTTAQTFLPVSVYMGLSLLLFFLLCFILYSFSFLVFFPAAYLCTNPGGKKKALSASWWPPSIKNANWALRTLREFSGNYHGKYASSSFGREFSKYHWIIIHQFRNFEFPLDFEAENYELLLFFSSHKKRSITCKIRTQATVYK